MPGHESPLQQERALELLRAKGPLPAHAQGLKLFGRFAGAWDAEGWPRTPSCGGASSPKTAAPPGG